MRNQKPIKLLIYAPESEDGRLDLAKRVAAVHADTVSARIRELNCPKSQKQALLDAVIQTAAEMTVHP